MTREEIYEKLSAPLPKEAVQRADKSVTKKGYSTAGFGYQFIVNRFNEVLGLDGWKLGYSIVDRKDGSFASGKPYVELTVEAAIGIQSGGPNGEAVRKCVGGHISSSFADAYKGAITNALKKTAALFGVGKAAYEGTLDDDAFYEEEVGSAKKVFEGSVASVKEEIEASREIIRQKDETRKPLTYEELFNKMSTASNVFELDNRCKKYRPDYDALTEDQTLGIRAERDRRRLYLETGEIGDYESFIIVSTRKIKESV